MHLSTAGKILRILLGSGIAISDEQTDGMDFVVYLRPLL